MPSGRSRCNGPKRVRHTVCALGGGGCRLEVPRGRCRARNPHERPVHRGRRVGRAAFPCRGRAARRTRPRQQHPSRRRRRRRSAADLAGAQRARPTRSPSCWRPTPTSRTTRGPSRATRSVGSLRPQFGSSTMWSRPWSRCRHARTKRTSPPSSSCRTRPACAGRPCGGRTTTSLSSCRPTRPRKPSTVLPTSMVR